MLVDVVHAGINAIIKKKHKDFSSSVTNKQFKDLLTCNKEGVVYMLDCLQYVGRTTRALSVRIGEHVSNIKKGLRSHNVSKHFRHYHCRDPRCLKFWGIEKVSKHWRGDHFWHLSQRE